MFKLLLLSFALCLVASACAEKKSPKPLVAAVKPAATVKPLTTTAVPDAPEQRLTLARVFMKSRCAMIGVLTPDPKLYTKVGFSDDAAFRVAFKAAADEDPVWARSVVEKAYSTSCRELEAKP